MLLHIKQAHYIHFSNIVEHVHIDSFKAQNLAFYILYNIIVDIRVFFRFGLTQVMNTSGA